MPGFFRRLRRRTEVESPLKEIIASCEANKTVFTDKDFPACHKSIGKPMEDRDIWLRAKDFMKETPRLFSDKIEPGDILQGELGDCYFLSSLAVLAERPDRIRALFRHHIPNTCGAYCVTLYFNGIETDVILDDQFPCNKATKQPLFTHCNGSELWVLLLEKAYAKLHGSYADIESGIAGVALSDLTGGPCFVHKLEEEDPDTVWKVLCQHDRLDHVMCCSAGEKARDSERSLDEAGLIELHAYSLIDVSEFEGNRLLHIRNPWGEREWQGAWSDKDTVHWTPEAKEALGYCDADDGAFWISQDDWAKYFTDFTVLVLEDGWAVASEKVKITDRVSSFLLETKEQADMLLTVHLRKDNVATRLCVVSLEKPFLTFGGSKEVFFTSVVLSTERMRLPPGCFLVVLEVFSEHASQLPMEITLTSYATSDQVTISSHFTDAHPEAVEAVTLAEFKIPSFGEKYGKCSCCGTELGANRVNMAKMPFHKFCVMCYNCGEPITRSAAMKNGKIHCVDCAKGRKPTRDVPAVVEYQEKTKKMIEAIREAQVPQVPPMFRKKVNAKTFATDKKGADEEDSTAALCAAREKAIRETRGTVTEEDMRLVFNAVDADGSGEIEGDELQILFSMLGISISPIEEVAALQAEGIAHKIAPRSNGKLNFKAFKKWYKSVDINKVSEDAERMEKCAKVYLHFDADGSGTLEGDELAKLYHALAQFNVTKVSYEEFLKALDKDGSGVVKFKEFLLWMEKNH